MRRPLAAGACAVWLLASVGGKAVRYSTPGRTREARTAAFLPVFMGHLGWHSGWTRDLVAGGGGRVTRWTRTGCQGGFLTAPIGPGGTAEAVTAALGPGTGFVRDGTVDTSPRQTLFALEAALAEVTAFAGGPGGDPPAVIAVSPAPGPPGGPCDPPGAAAWAAFRHLPP